MKKLFVFIILSAFFWNSCNLIKSDNPRYHNLKKIPLATTENKDSSHDSKINISIIKDSILSFIEENSINSNQAYFEPDKQHTKHIIPTFKPQKFKPSFSFPKFGNLAIASKSVYHPTNDVFTLLVYILIIALILTLISLFLPQFVEILIAVFLIALLILLILYLGNNLQF